MFNMSGQDPFLQWFKALELRHLTDLNFAEVRRGVQALSSLYVERRGRLQKNRDLDGAGKRAAFALYFAPLHFLLVREIIRALGISQVHPKAILDLGCGTGAAGAAWALTLEPPPAIIGIDRNAWAAKEARWTYQTLALAGTVRIAHLEALRIPAETAVIAAFTINELDDATRGEWTGRLLSAARRGSPVLVIEPIARRLGSWWDQWADAWKAAGGREDDWRFHIELPERLALMDRASGLDHRELTGRSLWLPGGRAKIPGHDLLPTLRTPE
jgi:hypothetical protein